MTRSRNGGGRWCGGGGGGNGGCRPGHGGTLHRKSSSSLIALAPRPLQSADQGVSEIFREQAVDVECDRIIRYL